jgi:hypothetical protein
VLIVMDEGEAEVRLPRVAFGVEMNEPPAQGPTGERSHAGVKGRALDHIAWYGKALAFQFKRDPRREAPAARR